jgi:hypothetical protein
VMILEGAFSAPVRNPSSSGEDGQHDLSVPQQVV